MKHIYIHGHGSVEKGVELKAIPSKATVVVYAPAGAAISDSFAEKIYDSTDAYNDLSKWIEGWAGWSKKVEVVRRTGTEGTAPELPKKYPILEDQYVFDMVLTGSGSLTHSGIYGEKKSGADNLICAIDKGKQLKLSEILGYLDGIKLLDKDTYVHWLACVSDHIDKTAKYSGWKITVS